MNLNKLFPFYNPANVVFNHNQSSRKSFSKGNGKLRLSIGGGSVKKATITPPVSITESYSLETGGMSSPNLSIEMIDEEEDSESVPVPTQSSFEFANYALSKYRNSIDYGNNLTSNDQEKYQLSKIIGVDDEPTTTTTTNAHNYPYQLPSDLDNFSFKPMNPDVGYSSDLDYYSNKNNILNNVSDNEDFPINTAQQPDYAPKFSTSTTTSATKKSAKSDNQQNRRSSPPNMTSTNNNNLKPNSLRKNSSTSVSTMDLHKVDEQFANLNINTTIHKKPMSRGSSPIRNRDSSRIKKSESSYQISNRDQHHHATKNNQNSVNNKNITVQFFNKPQRSKTAIDIKSANRSLPSSIPRIQPSQQQSPQQQQQHHYHSQENSYVPAVEAPSKESQETQHLISYHDTVFSTLCNRLTSLELIRNQTR